MLTLQDRALQSLQLEVASLLNSQGYGALYELEDSYPAELQTPLDKTLIVISLGDSDPAEDREVGGPLAEKRTRVICDVLGSREGLGRNISLLIQHRFESGEPLTLYDFSTNAAVDNGDYVIPDGVTHAKIGFANPSVWQQHWYVVQIALPLHFNREWLT